MMDRERADFADAVAALQGRLGTAVVPLQLPIGAEGGFEGVIDLLSMKAYLYSDTVGQGPRRQTSPPTWSPPPRRPGSSWSTGWPRPTTSCSRSTSRASEHLDRPRLFAALKTAVAAGILFPILATVGDQGHRHRPACWTSSSSRCRLRPRWAPGGARRGRRGRASRSSPTCPQPASLYIFKTIYDQFSGRINLARVFSGTHHDPLRAPQPAHGREGAHRQHPDHAGQGDQGASRKPARATSWRSPSSRTRPPATP